MPSLSTLVGLTKANAAIKKLATYAQDEAQTVAAVTAANVAKAASARAPRSADGSHGRASGFLASSISWRAVSSSKAVSAVVGVSRAAFYWKFLEYGTRFMSAQPFIRPAADEQRMDHRRRMIAGL